MRSGYLPNTCYGDDFPTLRNLGRGGFVYRYSCGAFSNEYLPPAGDRSNLIRSH
ncbi:hypothetical protein Q5692_20600 [Microcoleus sp. C2C3]|uniref:hypothetical protein n=1 Tax=unclassified Microcoleus TaxID=2642155 RepID=UPI002FD0D7D4